MEPVRSKLLRRLFYCLASLALVSFPTRAATQSPPEIAVPGTINYVEGEANIGGKALSSKSVGQVELRAGESLDTLNGRVEVLLTPGVYLRLGHNTSVRMVSPSLLNTKVDVTSGEAAIEVDELHSQNNLMVGQSDTTSYLVHTGYYDFDPLQGFVRVLKGQAVVLRNDYHIRVNSGHQVDVGASSGELKSQKFDKGAYQEENSLYHWSNLRSKYLAEASVNAAPYYYYNGWYGPRWWLGPGWHWNPWFGAYTFVPGAGVLYSPFGWRFYSPWSGGRAPYSVHGGRVLHFDRGFDNRGVPDCSHPDVSPRSSFGVRGAEHLSETRGGFGDGFGGASGGRR